MTIHSTFSPSAATRWITCPGSLTVKPADYETSVYAAEGTMMHNVSEQILKDGFKPDAIFFKDNEYTIDGHDFIFKMEHVDAVQAYIDQIRIYYESLNFPEMKVEERVSLDHYGERYKDIFGTVDCIIDEIFNKLFIIDLKGGKGVSVPADSAQTRLYAVMAAGELIDSYDEIISVIIQPRDRQGDYIRERSYTPQELKEWMTNTVLPAIENARSDNPRFKASEDACRWCPASGNCRYQTDFAFSVAMDEFEDFMEITPDSPFPSPKHDLTNDQIAHILKLIPFLDVWKSAIQANALVRMERGEKIKGFKLVEARTLRKWLDDDEVRLFLQKQLKMKVKDITSTKLKSPSAILKIAKPTFRDQISEYVVKPKGKPAIAPLSDKRPELEPEATAEKDFSEFTKE